LKVRFVGSLIDGGFTMVSPVSVSLLDHFATLSDPRQHAKVLYPLPEILLLVLASTIASADDFVEATLWGAEHLAFLRRFYRFESGIPSHDTLSDVFAALDGRRGNGSCSDSRRPRRNPMRSPPFRCC
jgi:hypothetical protein